jgi:uncharacterized damage-inducible protein DinB
MVSTLCPPVCSPGTALPEQRSSLLFPLVAVLRQLGELIESLDDEQYRTKPADLSSPVGGHVRHCLDHIDALLSGFACGTLDYDQRRRGTPVETSREAALGVLRRQERELLAFPRGSEDDPLCLTAVVAPALPPVVVRSSVARELVFVLSHTIHHNAIIAVTAKAVGATVPERFGYAPATLAHLEKVPCVR